MWRKSRYRVGSPSARASIWSWRGAPRHGGLCCTGVISSSIDLKYGSQVGYGPGRAEEEANVTKTKTEALEAIPPWGVEDDLSARATAFSINVRQLTPEQRHESSFASHQALTAGIGFVS